MDDSEIEGRLWILAVNDTGLVKAVRELVSYVALLALAVHNRDSVPDADLDQVLKGLDELHALLARIGEFLPPIDETPLG